MRFVEPLETRFLLSGVTLIAHGAGGGIGGWVSAMAMAIDAASPGQASIYDVKAVKSGSSISVSLEPGMKGPQPNAAGNSDPEIILLLDWSDMAGAVSGANLIDNGVRSTVDVAAAVSATFFDPGFIPNLGGPLAELPIHLIGHSRGGSLVAEMARDLGERGVWVDQVTTLDPHPVNSAAQGGLWGDSDPATYDNVIFADNYWRSDGSNPAEPGDFDGQLVPGAHNVQLSDVILEQAGYSPSVYAAPSHLDVILWYQGTIGAPYPNSNGEASVGANWYTAPEPARQTSGFYHSEIAGGTRPTDGLGSAFGGVAARVNVARSGTQWPNIAQISSGGTSTLVIGQTVSLSYRYEDTDSGATVGWYLDNDANPLNGFSHQLPSPQTLASTGANVKSSNYSLSTAGLAPGAWHVVARISDTSGQVRYEYLPQTLTLVGVSSISGIVFNDSNGNGSFENEAGIAGITVYSDANNNGKLDGGELSVVTDVSGRYSLLNLVAGNYKIRESLPAGAKQTTPANNFGWTISLSANQSQSGKNFGEQVTTAPPPTGASISGTVFNDANGNLKQDNGEAGLSAWKVYIDANNDGVLDNGELSMLSESDGSYSFTGLKAGTYIVRAVRPSGWSQTTPSNGFGQHVTVGANQSKASVVFGERHI